MPERRVRVTKPGSADRSVLKSELADHIAAGWVPKWDQSVETLATQVRVLRDAVVDLAGQIEDAGPAPEGGEGGDAAGADGRSAYQVAVDNGFQGTVQQWLASLVGPAGAASTVPGPAGSDGKSAYQLARDGGYGGTQTQWLASLVGAQGQQGIQGPQGQTGSQGSQGIPGTPGPNLGRRVIVSTGALTANTVKPVPVTWPTAMPDTSYAVTALVESTTPQTVAIGVNPSSRTTTGCTLSVRSTAAVSAPGLNVHVIGLA